MVSLRHALTLGLMLVSGTLSAAEPTRVEDRILAAVDDDPILASDVERALRLGLAETQPGQSEAEQRKRVLEAMIAERLRFHEVDRYGLTQVSVEEIERRTEQIRSTFATEEEFQARLAALSLTEAGLAQLVARQLMVLAYVEDRLAARVLVGLEDVRRYYETVLAPALAAQGEPTPPLEEVRETIRAVLREQRLNEEIARWTDELEARANVERYPLEPSSRLPPLVETITAPASPPGKSPGSGPGW